MVFFLVFLDLPIETSDLTYRMVIDKFGKRIENLDSSRIPERNEVLLYILSS